MLSELFFMDVESIQEYVIDHLDGVLPKGCTWGIYDIDITIGKNNISILHNSSSGSVRYSGGRVSLTLNVQVVSGVKGLETYQIPAYVVLDEDYFYTKVYDDPRWYTDTEVIEQFSDDFTDLIEDINKECYEDSNGRTKFIAGELEVLSMLGQGAKGKAA